MIKSATSAGIVIAVFLSAGPALAADVTKLAQQAIPTVPVTGPVFIAPPRIIEAPSEVLSCPVVTTTPINLPPPVYDMTQGDCALVGKAEEIEAYLQALEEEAAFCKARQESSWEELVEAKARLDKEINALPPTVPTGGTKRPGMPKPPDIAKIEPDRRIGWRYTNWLNSIRENTLNYCRVVDELPKTLAHTCTTISQNVENSGGGATDIEKMVFRQWLTRDLNATRSYDYDAATQYYNDTLETDGWGNFRRYYREDKIRCSEG